MRFPDCLSVRSRVVRLFSSITPSLRRSKAFFGVVVVSLTLLGGQKTVLADPPPLPPIPADFIPWEIEPGCEEWFDCVIRYFRALIEYFGGNPDDLQLNTANIDLDDPIFDVDPAP